MSQHEPDCGCMDCFMNYVPPLVATHCFVTFPALSYNERHAVVEARALATQRDIPSDYARDLIAPTARYRGGADAESPRIPEQRPLSG